MSNGIVFYISAHGFGHASRMIEVINAILAKRPEIRIGVRTAVPRWLFDLTIKGHIQYSHLETDTGVVQVDSLTLDEADSIRRASSFHADFVTRAASETQQLRAIDAGLVVGDIPPLAFAVAASAGLPSIAIGNFTWDWIYSDYPRIRLAPSLLPTIQGAYAKATMALKLPMSEGFSEMPKVKDIPFIARHATKSRKEVCSILKLPTTKPIVLMSFGGYGLPSLDTSVLTKLKKYTVVTVTNIPLGRTREETKTTRKKLALVTLDEQAVYDLGVRYEDLVAASEVVVTKPGYGIIAECIANNTAVLYTSRGHFPEYDVLTSEMPKYLRCAFMNHDDLFAGKWESHLDSLLAQAKPKKSTKTNGAEIAADILLSTVDNPPKSPRRKRGRAKKTLKQSLKKTKGIKKTSP